MAQYKNSEVHEVYQALLRLDGFKFDGKTNYSIAKNIRKAHAVWSDVDELRVALVVRISGGSGVIPPNTPEIEEYNKAFNELMRDTSEMDLHKIPLSGLNLDENKIPVTVVAALGDLIDEEI